jgi:hypothetical protein
LNCVPLLEDRPIFVLEADDRNTSDNQALAESLRKAGNIEGYRAAHAHRPSIFGSSDRNAGSDRELAGGHHQSTAIEPFRNLLKLPFGVV